jgi:phage FluMu protein Com
VMDETDDECPRCKLIEEYTTDVERRIRERELLFEDVE